MTIQELHAVNAPKLTYRPYHHAAGVHTLIGRMRRLLAPLSLNVAFARGHGRYRIETTLPFYGVTVAARSQGRAPLTARQEEILVLLRGQEHGVSTTEICRNLGIRRQTAHPMLRALVEQGRVRLRRRGRSSRYLLITGPQIN